MPMKNRSDRPTSTEDAARAIGSPPLVLLILGLAPGIAQRLVGR